MNDLIARVTSTGLRKYIYRVAWAGLAVAIAYGKLDASQLEVILGLVAAVLAVADSQTAPDNAVVSYARMEAATDKAFDHGMTLQKSLGGPAVEDSTPEVTPQDTLGWEPSEGTWEA